MFKLPLFIGVFLIALVGSLATPTRADEALSLKHLSGIDEATAVKLMTDGSAPIAALSPSAALSARASGVPIRVIYLLDRGKDERYVVVRDDYAAGHAMEIDALLRALDAHRRDAPPAVPGPAQTAQLRLLAIKLASELTQSPGVSGAALDLAAATIVDRATGKRALAQVSAIDRRCGNFCDHW